MGCFHDFGTPDSAWVQRYGQAGIIAARPQQKNQGNGG